MIRKLSALLVAGACAAAGFAVGSSALAEAGTGTGPAARTSPAAASRTALPHPGTYSGVDHAGRIVTFSFAGNYLSHFTVGHHVIGGAHVGSDAWHETCHGGYCTRGRWVSDTHVTGSWRTPGGHWTTFSATLHPQATIRPYVGSYLGRDHTGLAVHLSFGNGTIHGFRLDHSARGNVPVTGHRFDTCLPSICVKGHWQSEYEVVGSWRPAHSDRWVPWEAHAYAA